MKTLSWIWRFICIAVVLCQQVYSQTAAEDFSLNFSRAHRSTLEDPLVFQEHYSFTEGPIGGPMLFPGTPLASDSSGLLHIGTEWWSSYLFNLPTHQVKSIEPKDRPIGAAYDTKRNLFYIATLSGEGFLYKFDPVTQLLTEVTSLQNQDLDSLVYHPADDSLYALNSSGELVHYSINGIKLSTLPVASVNTGFYVHGYRSALISLGNFLAVLMEARREIGDNEVKESRIYKVDPTNRSVQQTYRRVWSRWPFNTLPLVRLDYPAPTNFIAGITLGLTATATDYEVGIKSVHFSVNGELVEGQQQENNRDEFRAEYRFTIAGEYEIRAIAVDWDGGTNSSQTVRITIQDTQNSEFSIPFTQAHRGVIDTPLIFWQGYNLGAGAIGGGRLLPGMLLDGPDAAGNFFGTEGQNIYRINQRTDIVERIIPNVHDFSWPTGISIDSKNGGVRVVSLGGEGHLLAYYPESRTWKFISSMQNRDVDSLEVYNGLLYAMETKGESQNGKILVLNAEGAIIDSIGVANLPFAIGPGSYRSEIVSYGDYLVLMVEPREWFTIPEGAESRMYLIDPRQRSATLSYRKVWTDGEPTPKPPVATWLSPVHGSSVSPGTNIDLRVTASDPDGQVNLVQFLSNGNVIGTGSRIEINGSIHYEFQWTPTIPGTYELSARVIDDSNLITVTPPVTINVPVTAKPYVTITYPAPDGMLLTNGTPIKVTATARAYGGAIVSLRFFANGQFIGNGTRTGSTADGSQIYERLWTNLLQGTNILLAEVTTSHGQTTLSQPRFVIVSPNINLTPFIIIAEPKTGARYTVGDYLELKAFGADPDGRIVKVEILNNLAPFGLAIETNRPTLTNQAFVFRKQLEVPGIYRLTAKATDNQGNTGSTTDIVHVLVQPNTNNIPPTVAIVSPANGTIFNEETRVRLIAAANDQDGHVAKVEFFANQLPLGQAIQTTNSGGNQVFELTWKVVRPATYFIQAKAYDDDGTATWSSPLSFKVIESGEPNVLFTADFIPFYRVPRETNVVSTRSFTEEGEANGDRLLPGYRVVKLGNDYYGAENHQVIRINGNGLTSLLTPAGVGLPELSWPVGIAADTARHRVLLASLGGDGYLYAYYPQNNHWELVKNLKGKDYDAIEYHAPSDNIFAVEMSSPGANGRVARLNPAGDVVATFQLPRLSKGIGFSGFRSEIISVDESLIAVLVESNIQTDPLLVGSESHMFLIDLRNGVVTEVYSKIWEAPPVHLSIVSPANGQEFVLGERIQLLARIEGGSNPLLVYFTANGTNVAPAARLSPDTNLWRSSWLPQTTGTFELVAHSRDSKTTNHSAPITIVVKPPTPVFPPIVNIMTPASNSVFQAHGDIRVVIRARGVNTFIRSVEVYDGEVKLGNAVPLNTFPPEPPVIQVNDSNVSANIVLPPVPADLWEFIWRNVPSGNHHLIAKAIDSENKIGTSPTVPILVRETPTNLFQVTRTLPSSYLGGVSFQVKLSVTGAEFAGAYAIEDVPPANWSVSNISHDGVYDRTTGKVKFGPYTDNQNRIVTYTVTPPASAQGMVVFTGRVSEDDQILPIGGATQITSTPAFHPADVSPRDNRIEIHEVTAFATAWRDGNRLPDSTNAIPVSYVTRAGFIWKRGETYRFDPSQGSPPLCWVPTSQIRTIPSIEAFTQTAEGSATRHVSYDSGTVLVRIFVEPGANTANYALEEKLPEGWTVVSKDFEATIVDGTLRWGPFFDDTPRELTYSLATPESRAKHSPVEGLISFDGNEKPIEGQHMMIGKRLSMKANRSNGGVHIRLDEAPGRRVRVEATEDLSSGTWVEIGTIEPGVTEVTLPETGTTKGFYRLRED